LRHILPKPSPAPGRQPPRGGIERQHAVGDRGSKFGISTEDESGDSATCGGAADRACERRHRLPLNARRGVLEQQDARAERQRPS
jgi:hypothetical protein